MATFLVRMTVYAPDLITALGALKRNRKQSAFLVESLRQFLSTEDGQTLLRSMAGATMEEKGVPAKYASGPYPAKTTDLDEIFHR